MSKRAYGTGSLAVKHGAWYGRWWTLDGRRLQRRMGEVRSSGSSGELTRREAESELRRMILAEEARPMPVAAGRHTVDDAALALIEHKRIHGMSKSYLQTLSGAHRHHFGPVSGRMPLRRVHRRDVEALSARLLERGLAPRTVANTLKAPARCLRARDRSRVDRRQPGAARGAAKARAEFSAVLHVTLDRAADYMSQATQYASDGHRRLSILVILRMTPKDAPSGVLANTVGWLEPALHGLTDPAYPPRVAVVIVNGNLTAPSAWSR